MFGPLPAFPGSLMSGCAGWGRGPQGLSPVPREGPWKGWLPVVIASARCSKSPGSSWRPVRRWPTGGLQQAPTPPDSPGPHPLPRSAAASSPGQGTRPRLFASTGSGEQPVSTKRCFYCSFPPTRWLPCQSLASPSPPPPPRRTCPHPGRPPLHLLLLSLNFFFFLPRTGNCETGKALEYSVPNAPQQFSEGHKAPW